MRSCRPSGDDDDVADGEDDPIGKSGKQLNAVNTTLAMSRSTLHFPVASRMMITMLMVMRKKRLLMIISSCQESW